MNMSAWAIRLLLGATTPQTWDAFHAPALRRTGIHDNPRLFFFMLSMASRALTSAMYSDDDDDDLGRYDPESSPDPLAGSIAVDRPKPNPRRKPARSSKEPLVTSSPSKTNRRPSVAEQVLDQFSSPSKSMVLSTGRNGGASPWRIKVTVEAEPGSDDNMESPIVRHATRTKTTTVPLKDPDASSPVKRLGRPRKSEASSSAKPKRSGTPVRRRAEPKERDSSVGAADAESADTTSKKRTGRPRKSIQPALDDSETLAINEGPLQDMSSMDVTGTSAADIDTDSAPKKRGGRLRKNKQPTLQDKETSTISEDQHKRTSFIDTETSKTSQTASQNIDSAPKKRRGRPRKSQLANEESGILDVIEGLIDTPAPQLEVRYPQAIAATPDPLSHFVVPVIQTTLATPQEPQLESISKPALKSSLVPPKDMARKQKLMEYDEPTVFTPPETDFSRHARARKGTPAANVTIVLSDSSDDDDDISTPSGTDDDVGIAESRTQDPLLEAVIRPDESGAVYEDEEDYDELQDVTNFPLDEGITRMADDTTMLESENFSMISVDSLPSSNGHSSPMNESNSRSAVVGTIGSMLDQSYLQIPSATSHKTRPSPLQHPKSPTEESFIAPMQSSPPVVPRREHTPAVDPQCPSNPPSIVPAHFSPTKVEVPGLGRAVTAGVALQGVLDPNRVTPSAVGKKRDSLDDLFRGFSEGTRRELQAGLRLGEQLAQQRSVNGELSAAGSRLSKVAVTAESSDDIFRPQTKHRVSRLLTPEEQADYTLPLPPPQSEATEVQYPLLRATEEHSHLVSPAISDDEMSWRVDTPPVRAITAEGSGFVTAINEQGDKVRGTEILIVADEDGQNETVTNENGNKIRGKKMHMIAVEDEQEDYSDIWQEEASRSSVSPVDGDITPESEKSPQLQDLFTNDGPIKPPRGKLPNTWRRKSSSNFHYSDEPEPEAQQLRTPSSIESEKSPLIKLDKGKGKAAEPPVEAQYSEDEENDFSEASDDTGMFFQSNLPNVFDNEARGERRAQNVEKKDLAQVLGEGQSLLPESSPSIPIVKTPSKHNPFKNAPPRFSILQTSPVKSSPLRQEVRASDSEDSYQQGFEESTLPLPPSSPFRTMVDEVSISTGSDERQIRMEMETQFEGQTDSSIRRVRYEADEYLEAYEQQERTLEEIAEVTEYSRSRNSAIHQSTILPSSPPQALEDSILASKRTYAPLFENAQTIRAPSTNVRISATSRPTPQHASTPVIACAPQQQAPQPSAGIFTKLTSSLWSAVAPAGPPPQHPVVLRFDALPKVEPWTKTHYKTLDALYQLHKKQPMLFAPSTSTNTNTNNPILTWFVEKHEQKEQKFVGALFLSWGYEVTLTESLVVLCAVFMQLLSLGSVEEYERESGKKIQIGDCGPGPAGSAIEGGEVVRRLMSVIMGERLRRDERKGREVKREGGMTVVWPK
jgi:hypothetical protein